MSTTSRWKPPILIRKTSLAPSLSFVLAEPRRTRSQASAADSLPNILRRAMQSDRQHEPTPVPDPSSSADDCSEPPAVESIQSLAVHPPTPPEPPLAHTSVSPPIDDQPLAPVDPPTPLIISQDPVPHPSFSDKRSWFNVFYWPIDKETISQVKVGAEVNSTPQAPDAVHIITQSQRSPQHAVVAAVDPAESLATVANSGEIQSLPKDAVLCPVVDAPSAHEEQPVSQSTPNPLSHHSPLPLSRENVTPPSAPNTASGMFALNFPMLAKPRPSPDTAVTLPPQDSSAGGESFVATPDPGNTLNAVSLNVTERTNSTSTVHVSDCGDLSLSHPTAATDIPANAWWSWWWSANSSAPQPYTSAQNSSQSIDAYVPSATPERLTASDSVDCSQPFPSSALPAPTQPESEMKARVGMTSDLTTMSLPLDDKKLQDADAAGAPHGSTWYTPWSWYQSSSSATTNSVAPEMNSGSQQDPHEQSEMRPQTEEKSSPEAHSTLGQASQDLSAAGSPDYSNPIQSVISANPTGWMSFFTAKAIAMKSITYEKDDGTMEVMEIDDEIAPEPKSVSSSASAVIQPSPTQVPKATVGAQPHTADIPPSSSPHSRKPNDKRPPIPLAATKSETVANDTLKRRPSPSPSKKSSVKIPTSPPAPNLVLPTWKDTFHTLPRSAVPREPPSVLSKTLQYVSGVLFSREEVSLDKGKGKAKEARSSPYDKALPRTWDALGRGEAMDVLRGCKRVVVIGVHGWFPGAVLRTFAGEPTGTSSKLVSGIVDALDLFLEDHKAKLDKVTKIPLEGEGTINRRVERLYQNLIAHKEWMDDLHDADAIFVATHSQGSVVSTHLLDRLISDCHIRTALNADASIPASGVASGSIISLRPPQRICCLALCGIHLGPLRYLSTSSLVQPYIQYFESTAARELFEFQNTESAISRDYVRALRNVLNNGIKMVYIASLNDQVVGLYSGLFTSVSHPLILRALYIDGDAYHPTDFLCKLLVLLLRIRNAGLSDGGLLTHLSEVTAGSLNGIGHSTPYEERATYALAINYLFLTDGGSEAQVEFIEESFNALAERNDYEIPWALRDLVADDRVINLFSDEIVALRDAFRDWHPKTSILRDVKRKLQPIQRLSSALQSSRL